MTHEAGEATAGLRPRAGRSREATARPLPPGPRRTVVAPPGQRGIFRRWWLGLGFLAVWGPGLVVMLADTDAGSLITASQSGAQWGYRMILPQLILMPILYVVQEITVRLGIVTKRGHGALIRERFGRWWALLSAGTLLVSAIGALLTEFAGIAGVGQLFGLSPSITVPIATAFLVGLAMTGSYRRVERIGIAVGIAELAFFVAVAMSHPHADAVAAGLRSVPLANGSYLLLVAANVGAVIMPWMIFYQQGAVIDKKLSAATIRQARLDTAVGSVLTQLIMIAVVIAVAATVGRSDPGAALQTVGQIAGALTPHLGHFGGTILFGLGMLGAALVAAIVSSVAGAWGIAEAFGWKHSLNERPSRSNAKFYATYALVHILGAFLVLTSVNLVSLSIDVMVMNAMLLPIVLGFLLALEARVLPAEWRMFGARKYLTWAFCMIVMGFGLAMIPASLHLL
jgi:Mn2+/Fe2+ NRAMP family transporter